MIKVLIIAALYLIIGELWFSFVIAILGGKEAFKIVLGDDDEEADLVYLLCHFGVVVLWPVFLVGGIINRKKKEEE